MLNSSLKIKKSVVNRASVKETEGSSTKKPYTYQLGEDERIRILANFIINKIIEDQTSNKLKVI